MRRVHYSVFMIHKYCYGKLFAEESSQCLSVSIVFMSTCSFLSGELQSILCVAYAPDDITYTGTLSGDVYKWKGHTLQSAIKGAHSVSCSKN